MEQKEIVEKVFVRNAVTIIKFLEMINRLAGDNIYDFMKLRIPVEGEVELKRFLKQYSDIRHLLLHSKLNLIKVKELINSYGISCAYNETIEGTQFYFRAKDEKVIQLAMKELLKHLVTKPEQNIKHLIHTPNRKNFYEKLRDVKKLQYKGSLFKVVNKTRSR